MDMNSQHPQALLAAIGIIGFVVIVILALAIGVAICYFLMTCFKRIPAEFRKQEPGMVWLLLIPCFNIVWNFFVYPKLADSYQAYFQSVGRTEFGDCGRQTAMIYCILVVASIPLSFVLAFIPIVGPLANCAISIATLVFWIMVLVKAASLKGQIPETPAA